jgi:predicted O-methyltransferase YrrM
MKFALMMGSADAAQVFLMLIRTYHYKRCIEVGTRSGYTSVAMALTVSDDGLVYV